VNSREKMLEGELPALERRLQELLEEDVTN
jgi:hypothetical protein